MIGLRKPPAFTKMIKYESFVNIKSIIFYIKCFFCLIAGEQHAGKVTVVEFKMSLVIELK